MKTGGDNSQRWDSRNDRRNSYPPPAHVTAYGQSRFSSPGPWPRQRPSYYSNSPGGYNPYQRDSQPRHSGGGRQYGGHSQHGGQGGYSQHGRQSQHGGYSQHDNRGSSYGRDGGYGRQGSYGGGNQNDPRRHSTGVRSLLFLNRLDKAIVSRRKTIQ